MTNECPECGAEFHSLQIKHKILHDGLGTFYIGRCCPACGFINDRLRYEDGEIRPDLREQAEKDPDPPAEWQGAGL